MPAPKPALKYQLLPELRELNPGNAAQNYLKCFMEQRNFFFSKEAVAERARYQTMPLAELPARQAAPVRRLRAASRPTGRPGWIRSTGRPSSASRTAAWNCCRPSWGRSRFWRRRSRYGSVPRWPGGTSTMRVRTAKTMFALARHLGEHPTEVANLVGLSVAHLGLGTLEEMVQQPGCPNLYWALTDLPCPLVDLRKGVQGDRTLVAAELRSLRDDAPMTETEIGEVREPAVRRDRFRARAGGPAAAEPAGPAASASQGPGTGPRRPRDDAWSRRVMRQRIARSERFPPLQVILLDEKRDYEVERDERMKLLALPLWQIDALVGGKERARDGDGLFADLLPHIIKLRRAQGRLEQQIALLAARRGAAPVRRGARRQAAREAVPTSPCRCPSTRSPASRSIIRSRGRPPTFAAVRRRGEEQGSGIQRPLRGDAPEVIDAPLSLFAAARKAAANPTLTPRCTMAVTLATLDQIDPAEAWQPWQPSAADPWGRKWAAHLYRRAAFGPSREDLLEAERLGLAGHARPAAAREGPTPTEVAGDPGRCRPHRRRRATTAASSSAAGGCTACSRAATRCARS